MQWRRVFMLVAAFPPLASAACSSFSATNNDGGTDAIAAEDSARDDAGVNLLSNASFSNGCAGWRTSEAALTTVEGIARSAPKSCLVCGLAGMPSWFIYAVVTADAPVGSAFYGEAYVRSAPDAAPPPASVFAQVDIVTSTEDAVQYGVPTPSSDVGENWRMVSAGIEVAPPDGGSKLWMKIGTDDGRDRCFLVDDALVRREK